MSRDANVGSLTTTENATIGGTIYNTASEHKLFRPTFHRLSRDDTNNSGNVSDTSLWMFNQPNAVAGYYRQLGKQTFVNIEYTASNELIDGSTKSTGSSSNPNWYTISLPPNIPPVSGDWWIMVTAWQGETPRTYINSGTTITSPIFQNQIGLYRLELIFPVTMNWSSTNAHAITIKGTIVYRHE